MKKKVFHVLLTKSFPTEYLSHFTPEGSHSINWIQEPFIHIHLREVPQLQSSIDKISAPCIFSSQNAVRSFMTNSLRTKSRTAFAISGATAELLLNNHWNILGRADDATELAELILSSGHRELLFFCGNRRLDILPDKLRSCGIKLHEFVLYDTHLNHLKVHEHYDAVAFFSPSAAEAYFATNYPAQGCHIFALGRSTAAEIRKHWKGEIITGHKPTKDSLFKSILIKSNEHTQ